MPIEISSVARNILVEEILIQADLTLAAHARVRELTLDLENKDNRLVWGGHSVFAKPCSYDFQNSTARH